MDIYYLSSFANLRSKKGYYQLEYPSTDFHFFSDIFKFGYTFLENYEREDTAFFMDVVNTASVNEFSVEDQKLYLQDLGVDFNKWKLLDKRYCEDTLFESSYDNITSYYFFHDVMLPRIDGHRIALYLKQFVFDRLPLDFLVPPRCHQLDNSSFEHRKEEIEAVCAMRDLNSANPFIVSEEIQRFLCRR